MPKQPSIFIFPFIKTTLAGVLLWLSFPPHGYTFLAFVALVPLLMLENDYSAPLQSSKPKGSLWLWTCWSFLVFNLLTTFWVKNAAWIGLIAGGLWNILLMSSAIYLFHIVKKKMKKIGLAYVFLVCVWVGIEYLHLNSNDLDFPWLILGNAFAMHPTWIQWYRWTGVLGGSMWIVWVNILVFQAIQYVGQPQSKDQKIKSNKRSALASWFVSVPFLVSYGLIFFDNKTPDAPKTTLDVLIVQPNIDAYEEKFNADFFSQQTKDFVEIIAKNADSNTRLVVFPETSVPDLVYFEQANWQIDSLKTAFKRFPKLNILIGAVGIHYFKPDETPTPTARGEQGSQYEVYNAALLIDRQDTMQHYIKSKLVIGVEKMPFVRYLGKFLSKMALNLGGTSVGLGKQAERENFVFDGNIRVSPVICYESIFGEYVGDYVKKSTNLIAIITNDAWWGNTDGHKQHLHFARLRAIETQTYVVRSANTGISAVISDRGELLKTIAYGQSGVIKAKIPLKDATMQTFYVRYGDYLGRIAVLIAGILLLMHFVKSKSKK